MNYSSWQYITYLELYSSNSSIAAEISSIEARTNMGKFFYVKKNKVTKFQY